MIRCGQCGKELPPEFGDKPHQQFPECQSMSRAFQMTAEPGSLPLAGGDTSLAQTRPGLQSTARADDQGKITLQATGPGPRNEDDALEICARLVRALNKMGEGWSIPVECNQDIDGSSTSPTKGELQMQVVRASHNRNLWRELNTAGSATIEYDPKTAALEMIEAIRKKSKKYPPEQKREMSLVLDTARTPSHTFRQVLDAFRAQHRKDCQEAGFAQVWAVGPQDSLVERLDQ